MSWDGVTERRGSADWLQDKQWVLSDIKETKADVSDVKKDVTDIKIGLAELRIELKQIVSQSASRTSTWVSLVVSVISGIIVYFMTEMK